MAPASASASTTATTATATTPRRPVSARRGSVVASDPYGHHIEMNMDPARSTSSKLSIVRVVSPPAPELHLPSSPAHRYGRGMIIQSHSHRRVGSAGNSGGGSPRMSFASASFATQGSPGSPTSSSGSRPSSPTYFRTPHSSTFSKPRLNPEQLVALAHESCSPRLPSLASPEGVAGPASVDIQPANFTELPDDVFLPFVNRAQEVTALFAIPPCSKLLALLAQTFAGSLAAAAAEAGDIQDAVFSLDPKRWSADHLTYWLKEVDRDRAPDDVWVACARRCVLEHSELIWQRIKGALGVPPDLDADDAELSLLLQDGEAQSVLITDDVVASPLAEPGEHVHSIAALAGESPAEPGDSAASDANTADRPSSPPPPPSDVVAIEHIYAGSTPTPMIDLPPARPGTHVLSEAVQEEDESEDAELKPASPPREVVQGIRISTVPASPGLFATLSPALSARSLGTSSLGESLTSLPAALAVPDSAVPPTSSGSYTWTGRRRSSSASSYRHYASSVASSEGIYDARSERGPGNPLFPSSFARLAPSPTLAANNSALRRPTMPPPPAFGNPHSIRGRRGVPSWAGEFDPARHESAVASDSSMSAVGAPS